MQQRYTLGNLVEFAAAAMGAVTCLFMIWAAFTATSHASGNIQGVWCDDVIVYYKDAKGVWHWRKSMVEHIKDAEVYVCVQFLSDSKEKGLCFYTRGNETVALTVPFQFEQNL